MKNQTTLCIVALMLPLFARTDYQILCLPPLTPGEQLPAGWTGHQPAHLERIGGSHSVTSEDGIPFLRLTKQNFDSTLRVQTEIGIPPGQTLLEFRVLSRVPEIKLPDEYPGRNRFRAGIVFLNRLGEEIPGSYPQISIGDVQPDWTLATQEVPVPQDAGSVRLSIQLLNCTGVWEIRDVELRVKP